MRRVALTLGLGALAMLSGCLPGEAPAPRIRPTGPGASGDVVSGALLPADPYAEARAALGDRVAARERRFREAHTPGALWSWLRVSQLDIDDNIVAGAALTDIGRELFAIDFTKEQGLGNGLAARKSALGGPRPAPNLRHVQQGDFGGPDGTRCLGCHHLGGEGGAGFRADNSFLDGDGVHPASGLERNPRALIGGALLQLLGEEMTAELREQARAARSLSARGEVPLRAKGVSFGKLRARGLAAPGLSGVVGVGTDLIVRPFGWKGDVARLRDAVEAGFARNLGVQPDRWVRDGRPRGVPARLGDGPPEDPDADGVESEATDGMISAVTYYLASLAPPIEAMPEDPSLLLRASRGAELFQTLGCAGCHVPELPLAGTVVELGARPRQLRVDLAPLLTVPGRPGRLPGVRLYSDLRLHDMGDSLAEPRRYHGVPGRLWMTPPLWGVSASAPYLHDGRAASIDDAIRAHDGEGRASRDVYERLGPEDVGALNLFLSSLDRPAHVEMRR